MTGGVENIPWLDRWLGPVPDFPRPAAMNADRRASIAVWSAAVLMVLLIFRGGFDTPGDLYSGWASVDEDSLAGKMYWVAWGAVTYLIAPMAIIFFVFRESPARYGFRIYFTKKSILVYAALTLLMMLPLLWASTRPSFIHRYPLVNDLHGEWSRIWTWEIIRSLRFVCLEFFFRGFLLFAIYERFGYHAIAIAALPYGVIHFAKPFPEAMGAVAAGAILGLLALRTRSIAGGAVLHSMVAASMDFLALYRQGAFD